MSSSNNSEMWKSKLGTKYPMDFMKANEKQFHRQLQSLRHDPANRDCADCGAKGCTMWASVNLGVFLCITCGSHHRSLGTHISKPKGCTGTYWWGPDELENMKTIGNTGARQIYGDKVPTGLTPTSNPMEWRKYLTDKYMHKKYAPAPTPGPTARQVASWDSCVHNDKVEPPLPSLVKEDVSSSSTTTNFMSFGREQGNKSGTIHHGGEDFFSSFGDSSALPIISDNRNFGTKDVDMLGLNSYAGNMMETKKDSMITSQSRGMMKNQDFFAEFGL